MNINLEYLNIADSNAIGDAVWSAIHSIDSGNNTGWNITNIIVGNLIKTEAYDLIQCSGTVFSPIVEIASDGRVNTILADSRKINVIADNRTLLAGEK